MHPIKERIPAYFPLLGRDSLLRPTLLTTAPCIMELCVQVPGWPSWQKLHSVAHKMQNASFPHDRYKPQVSKNATWRPWNFAPDWSLVTHHFRIVFRSFRLQTQYYSICCLEPNCFFFECCRLLACWWHMHCRDRDIGAAYSVKYFRHQTVLDSCMSSNRLLLS